MRWVPDGVSLVKVAVAVGIVRLLLSCVGVKDCWTLVFVSGGVMVDDCVGCVGVSLVVGVSTRVFVGNP